MEDEIIFCSENNLEVHPLGLMQRSFVLSIVLCVCSRNGEGEYNRLRASSLANIAK